MARIIVFSDFTCPFSFVTEAALWRGARESGWEIDYRAFQLFPHPLPLPAAPPAAGEEALLRLAKDVGVRLDRPGPPARTAKAHEAAHHARERGLERELRSAIFAAYWSEGRDIGRIDVLVELGRRVGLDVTELKVTLDIDQHTEALLSGEAAAREVGVTAVPTLIVRTGYQPQLIVGTQSYAQLRQAVGSG
ncbi:MAG TPA: DsbA family protein [Longimicrobiaceae bacterium]|nr:DsbA family protein [Longimicrobiaceae bacterium]